MDNLRVTMQAVNREGNPFSNTAIIKISIII